MLYSVRPGIPILLDYILALWSIVLGPQNFKECFPFAKVFVHVDHSPSDSWCDVWGLVPLVWGIKANGAGKMTTRKNRLYVTRCNAGRSNFKMPPNSTKVTFRCDSRVYWGQGLFMHSNDSLSECSTSLRSDHVSYVTHLRYITCMCV